MNILIVPMLISSFVTYHKAFIDMSDQFKNCTNLKIIFFTIIFISDINFRIDNNRYKNRRPQKRVVMLIESNIIFSKSKLLYESFQQIYILLS